MEKQRVHRGNLFKNGRDIVVHSGVGATLALGATEITRKILEKDLSPQIFLASSGYGFFLGLVIYAEMGTWRQILYSGNDDLNIRGKI